MTTKALLVERSGKIELPGDVLKRLGASVGTSVRLRELPSGEFVLEPCISIWDLRGSLNPRGIHSTIEEMEEAIAEAGAGL